MTKGTTSTLQHPLHQVGVDASLPSENTNVSIDLERRRLSKPQTMTHFLLDCEDSQGARCEEGLKIVISHIAVAAKIIANIVQRAGLHGLYGSEGMTNASGEEQKKLDVLSNDVFIDAMRDSNKVCLMVSEENAEPIRVCSRSDEFSSNERKKYAIVFDPLDGSSNIDCQVAVGTIFGIYCVKNSQDPCVERDILGCTGNELITAGYILYSSSVMFVLSTGMDVNVFTLDPNFGEFVLTKKNLKIPDAPKTIYSVNEGRTEHWQPAIKEFVQWCKKKNYTHRYIGSFVADVHRTLLYGGFFMYPAEKGKAQGKLRTLYECFPMAYLVEKAGGLATNGTKRILDLEPRDIHERTPIFLGCRRDCLQLASILQYAGSGDNVHGPESC